MTTLKNITAGLHSDPSRGARRLAKRFASAGAAGQRFLFGRNEHSAALAKAWPIDGFVDDFAADALWHGKPVWKGAAIPRDAIVVNCSFSIRPVSASRRIRELCPDGFLAYSDLMSIFPEQVPVPDFIAQTRLDFQRHFSRWEQLMNCLADDESRRILGDLLRFRLSGDIRHMAAYEYRPHEQYFEPFMALPPQAVFVDAGGFDGDTTEGFCRRNPDYQKVLLFEPSAANLQKARERLKDFHSITYIEKGLSDQAGMLAFNPHAGSASAVSGAGSCKIAVTTLDEEVQAPVTFVKMDLEGWELKALTGAERHIRNDYPHLAIAAYHHPAHFWQIFEQVGAVRRDYKVYLRHYTEGWSESVLFFVPNS